jgi:hypothetical protein
VLPRPVLINTNNTGVNFEYLMAGADISLSLIEIGEIYEPQAIRVLHVPDRRSSAADVVELRIQRRLQQTQEFATDVPIRDQRANAEVTNRDTEGTV